MAKTRNRLVLSKLDALSLVDSPANQHAAAVIAKRAVPDQWESIRKQLHALFKDGGAETYEAALAVGDMWEKNSALTTAVSSILGDESLSADQKRTKIDAALSSYRDDILSVNKAGKCPECGAVMKDGACATTHAKKAHEPPTGTDPMKRTAQTFTDLAKANEHIGVLTADVEKAEAATAELRGQLDTEVAKSDPDAAFITKDMSAAQVERVRAVRKSERDRIAKLEADAMDARRVAKVSTILKGIMSDDDDGHAAGMALVKCLDGVASDDERKLATEFVTKFAKQYVEVVKELDGMELGGAGARPAAEDARQDRLEKAARELMKSDKSLTLPAAVTKAMENDPSLYDEDDADEEGGE